MISSINEMYLYTPPPPLTSANLKQAVLVTAQLMACVFIGCLVLWLIQQAIG